MTKYRELSRRYAQVRNLGAFLCIRFFQFWLAANFFASTLRVHPLFHSTFSHHRYFYSSQLSKDDRRTVDYPNEIAQWLLQIEGQPLWKAANPTEESLPLLAVH
jgi:hypothetical protein